MLKAERREKARNRRQYGMKVSGKGFVNAVYNAHYKRQEAKRNSPKTTGEIISE